MHLLPGQVEGMVEKCLQEDSTIPCHETLGRDEAICRGFFDQHKRDVVPLRLAVALKVLAEDPVPVTTD